MKDISCKPTSLRMFAMLVLLLGAAIVLVLSSPVPTTSATEKNAPRSLTVMVQEECIDLPQEGPSDCTTDRNSSQTCRRNFRGPFTMRVFNPCTGETVLIEGEMHEVTHTTTNANSIHSRFHMEMHGTGTTVPSDTSSASGLKYLFANTRAGLVTDYTFSTNINGGLNSGPPPENFSDPMDVQIISRGASPNFMMHFVLHTNVSASGQTSCVVHTSESCSGQGEIGR